jgi:hypothetical protein
MIYEQRPQVCKDFECLWLASDMPEEMRPDRVHLYVAGKENDGALKMRVDPAFPDAWKNSVVVDYFLERGNHLLISVGYQITFLPCQDKPVPEKIMLDWTL